jgi:hypothetical protein
MLASTVVKLYIYSNYCYDKISVQFIFFCCLVKISKADIVVQGEINRQFRISNVAAYPAYRFYFIYQGYHYDRGYQAGKPDTLLIAPNESYYVSTRGNNHSLF